MAKNSTAAKTAETKKIDGTRLFLIIFAAIALVGILTALVFGIISHANSKTVDVMKDNLGKYISIDRNEYLSYDALINVDPVTDKTVENEIIKLLYQNRKATDGKNKIGQTIKVGDTANIYYYGYTLDENGKKVAFDGGCNFSSSVTALGIGSGSMIPGFELALVGKNSNDYASLTKRTDGVVTENAFAYITYTAVFYDGAVEKDATALIDLTGDVDAEWGEGFKDFLLGKEVGKKIEATHTVNRVNASGKTESDIYTDVTVKTLVEFSEGEPLTIDVTFPRPYTNSPDLEGKAVKFDIYIMTSVSYDTPEFTDEFIKDTLKVTDEELKDFEGATLVEKYTAKIRKDLDDKYTVNVNTQIDNAFWDHMHEVVKVKRLPKGEVNNFYRSFYNEVSQYYSSYQSYFSSFDQAARQYLGLAANADWEAELVKKSEKATLEKLIFYYIAREEGILPEGEVFDTAYDRIYNEMLDAYLEQYNVNREDFDSDEEYEEQVDIYRDMLEANYGEDYFTETVYFEHVMKILRANANKVFAE